MLALIDTISESIAELIDDNIEARFGGYSLPTAIKDLNKIVTDLSNLVAVKTNDRDIILLIVVNRSVRGLPVLIVVDCGNHLAFDLAHDLRGLGVSEGRSPSDATNIGHLEGLWGFGGHFAQLAH